MSSSLLTERPAVVEEVLHEGVMSAFNCLGSSADFGVVGCVVAAVSTEPFQDTEGSPKVEFYCRCSLVGCLLRLVGGLGGGQGRGIFGFFRGKASGKCSGALVARCCSVLVVLPAATLPVTVVAVVVLQSCASFRLLYIHEGLDRKGGKRLGAKTCKVWVGRHHTE